MRNDIPSSEALPHNTEQWTGRVLRIGVSLSAGLMILGLILAVCLPSSVGSLSSPSLHVLVKHVVSGTLDLVVLMFTPILRVVTAIVGFSAERDWRFVVISSIVLMMLVGEILYSLSLH
jgi:uncharacterized membrane protein